MRPVIALTAALLSCPVLAEEAEEPTPLEFDLEGEYFARGELFGPLFEGDGASSRMRHHLRLRPSVHYQDLASFHLEAMVLDGVVWGDNESLASTSLFAGAPSATGEDGRVGPDLQIRRAWTEFTIPVGQLRVGRQPSHWGMGLLANSGDGFDDTFGENHYGATYDRILFATRPIAIVQKIAGRDDSEIPLFLAVGMDRLVEDPLIQYYGYQCESGIEDGSEDYDARCDRDGDGVTDLDHGFTDEGRTGEMRGADWWADPDDDVMEMIYVLVYRGEDTPILGDPEADLTAGTYVVHRRQAETDSNVVILDAHLSARIHGVIAEFEGLTIQGKTRAITLPGAYDPSGAVDDPLAKDARIWGYAGRLGYEQPLWSVVLEHGYASGDDRIADERFTGRPLHPDHNVGLLLYEEVLARVSAAKWSEAAAGLWSKGGVYNSRYLFPLVTAQPTEGLQILAAFLTAWPDKPDGSIIQCRRGDASECSQYQATARSLGWEADLAMKVHWHEHLHFSLETAYAHTTDRIPTESVGLNPDGRFFTVQSRVGYAF